MIISRLNGVLLHEKNDNDNSDSMLKTKSRHDTAVSLLAAPEAVLTTTPGATRDEKFGVMISRAWSYVIFVFKQQSLKGHSQNQATNRLIIGTLINTFNMKYIPPKMA